MTAPTERNDDRGETDIPVVATSGLDFPVVGIGASAGGIAAVQRVLEGLPGAPGMAFVVVMHLSPKHESSAASIFQQSTSMPVVQVQGELRIERDHVYVIPPSRDLHMVDGHLALREPERARGRHVVVDLFFRTLAETHRERAIGIVLSGTGVDGSLGVAQLKGQGGIVIAQSPQDAEHPGMPAAAVASGKVDFILPAAEIPGRLLSLWNNARSIELPAPEATDIAAHESAAPQAAEKALREILQVLQRRTGNDFRHYKRGTMLRRIERRLQVNSVPTLQAYRQLLETEPAEAKALLDDMLIGVTQFFRDRPAFEALERQVLPKLFEADGDDEHDEPLRVWVPACSTGEEAYSLAILLAEEAARRPQPRKAVVFATDIDETAIAHAREGRYQGGIGVDVPPSRLRTFFTKAGDTAFRIAAAQREPIIFAIHNVLRDPPFSRLDLVSCRNLLIYLDRTAQAEVLRMFHFALKPGGYLFLGNSETAEALPDKLFTPVDTKARIYQARGDTIRTFRTSPGFATSPPPPPTPEEARGEAKSRTQDRAHVLSEIHGRLVQELGPPSVVVSQQHEIIHVSPRAGRYLQYREGEPSHNIVTAAHPALRDELRSCIYRAFSTTSRVESMPIRMVRGGQHAIVRLAAQATTTSGWSGPVALLTFEERVEEDAVASETSTADPVLAALERELAARNEQLQSFIEQHETSDEELKASNEELQAINEELRSASEELETSKEELQSVNEELMTVNHELKTKVDETGEINDDLQNLIGATQIATVFVDADMRIKRFTPAATSLFAIIPADLGRPLFDITHKLHYEALADDAGEVYRSLHAREREVEAEGGRWFLAKLLPYRTSLDRIAGVVLSFIDITSRRRAEIASTIGDVRMRLVAETMRDVAILTLDEGGLLQSWNKGAEALFGWTETEVLGRPIDIVFTPEDRASGQAAAEMRQARADGRAADDRWHLHKDGTRLFVNGVMTPIEAAGHRGFAKICRDATGRAEEEAARRMELDSAHRGERDAVAESASKTEFLAVMSHELKHPLNLINVNAQLLTTLPETQALPKVTRAARTILRTVKGQARIIDDLLDLARSDAGKLAVARGPLLLVEAIESAITWALAEARAKGIAFHTEGLDEPLVVDGDPVRIEQIAWNLLSNALKYNQPGGSVAVRLHGEPGMAVLEVRDTGRGIDAAFLPHVFEMFRQETATTTREQGGLGIGLALVKSLVELHGGRVEAESAGIGHGTTVRVSLPLDVSSQEAGRGGRSYQGRVLEGRRVLLVDDTPDTLETFGMLLQAEGADVVTASTAADAIAIAREDEFDLLISDIGMPDVDGYSLISALRSDLRTTRLPAVALTGYGRKADVQRALAAGFDAHLDKPVDFDKLVRTIADVFSRPRRPADGG